MSEKENWIREKDIEDVISKAKRDKPGTLVAKIVQEEDVLSYDLIENVVQGIELNIKHDRDGMLGIRNGKVIVRSPRGNGRFPVISVNDEVNIYVNGVRIYRPTVITPHDQVKIEIIPDKETRMLEVEVSPDRLSAQLTVYPPYKIVRKLMDIEPVPLLEVQTIEEIEEIEPCSLEDAYRELKNAGVVCGIIDGEVARAVAERSGKPILVVIGKPKVDGVDGYLQFVLDRTNSTAQSEYGKVDYRERSRFDSVKIGEVIARVVEPIEGEIGRTVTGEELIPKSSRPAQYVIGEGVREVNDCLVATINGRPALTGNTVEVLPTLEIKGDVDLNTGNIRFNGDVVVKGAVNSGMVIEAEGMISVEGLVENAEISARDGIIILSRVINSRVRTGGSLAGMNRILPLLRKILHDLELLEDAVQEVLDRMNIKKLSNVPTGRIVQLLIENKLRELPRAAKRVLSVIYENDIEIDENIIEAIRRVGTLMMPYAGKEDDVQLEISELIESLSSWVFWAEKELNKKADIQIDYAHNSEVYATGNIFVRGQGCFNTLLSAGEAVLVRGGRGVFRGGQIIAGGDVHINALGSEGSIVRISVPRNKKITCNSVLGSALVSIGRKTVRVDGIRGLTRIFEDSEGIVRKDDL